MSNTAIGSSEKTTKAKASAKKSLPAKLIRIRCTNLDIHKIVTPILDMAAIALKTTTASNLPNINSISSVLYPTKQMLAKILAAYENEDIDPNTIVKISVSMDIFEDLYKITFEHVRGEIGSKVQPYNLHLKPAMDHTLYKGMMVRHKEVHPEKIKEILECL